MPRTLAAAVRDQVSPKFRSRGETYFRDGSVTIVEEQPGRRVTAQVAGEYDYDVSLELLGGRLRVECDCPLFERTLDVCKHIWATILAADARQRWLSMSQAAVRRGAVASLIRTLGREDLELLLS